MKIRNSKTLSVTRTREYLIQIAEAGLRAIDTERAMTERISFQGDKLKIGDQVFNLEKVENIFVAGVGKCSLEAAGVLEKILGERITSGVVIDLHEGELERIKTFSGTHPFPTEKNVSATRALIELLKKSGENDLVIFIISGGGSTLLCQPKEHTCAVEAEIVKCLYSEGSAIQEVNTVRKHISLARGGNLAKYAFPSQVISLVFSDVPGDDLIFVASGPTVLDTTTVQDAREILTKYGVFERCGISDGSLEETPKDPKYFERVSNILFVSGKTALEAMALEAKSLDLVPSVQSSTLQGEASKVGEKITKELHRASRNTVLLYSGETTVAFEGSSGKGGRNQELLLSALRFLEEDEAILAINSDGKDNSDVAGAICDRITKEKTEERKLDPEEYLENHNSYEFFSAVGDQILTGPTGSNVSDLIIALKSND